MSTHPSSTKHHRARWAAIGAAVAVSLGAGGIGLVQATSPQGASAYVPITPCRLADTRPAPDNVGPRSNPLGAAETYTLNGWASAGGTGNCTAAELPDGTTGLELNVTAVGPSANTNLRFWPADEAMPLASNLNPSVGQPATPNSVSVTLSPTGQFNVFNFQGEVDVVIDVVGHYTDHNHDDRYHTKTQTDAALAAKANAADVYTKTEVEGAITDAGTTRTLSNGVATSLAPHECAFVFAFGVGADSAAGQLVSGYILDASDNEVPSINNQTAFRPGTVFRTSQGGTIGYIEVCNLSPTPKELPTGWKVVADILTP